MTTIAFTADDLAALTARGISVDEATRQVALLRRPPRALELDRPCRVGDGITVLTGEQERLAFERDVLFPLGGLDPADAERWARVEED